MKVKNDTLTESTNVRAEEEVVAFCDHDVIRSIQEDNGISENDAKVLLRDTMIFLWLCATHTDKALVPTKAIDKGWHSLYLWGKEYEQWCKYYFGKMIYHRRSRESDPPKDGNALSLTFELARRHFGELSTNWSSDPVQGAICEGKCSSKCSSDTGGGGSDCTPDYD